MSGISRSSGLAKTILQGTVKSGKKTRQIETEVGRQHQVIDRPGVRQVPEASGEQRKMEETGCDVILGAQPTPMVKGLVKVKVFVVVVVLLLLLVVVLAFF